MLLTGLFKGSQRLCVFTLRQKRMRPKTDLASPLPQLLAVLIAVDRLGSAQQRARFYLGFIRGTARDK